MKSKRYELPISPNYVSNWGIREAIREILQNAIDADKLGYQKKISYDESIQMLSIENVGAKLPKSSLVLGCSGKADMEGLIGKFGEGYKLALVVLLRKGMSVSIANRDENWIPSFKNSTKFGTQLLNIDVSPSNEERGVVFYITGVDKDLYKELLGYFPCIDDDYGYMLETDNGKILLEPKFRGKMFVEGLFIQNDDNFKYGYNFNSNAVELDRDRKAINYYELKKLTASAVVTAEKCSPEIFKAISDSYTDTREIKEVINDASERFLNEYREMFYEENELEDNTLVATPTIARQLRQMDISVPVVEGSEIESYLVAKANDKLGLIYEAKKKAEKSNDVEDAWSYLEESNYRSLKRWIKVYGRILSKKAKEEFDEILEELEPYHFDLIKDDIPDDFDWKNESIYEIKTEL